MELLGLDYQILGEKDIPVLMSIELYYTYPTCIPDLGYTENGKLYQLKITRAERKKNETTRP